MWRKNFPLRHCRDLRLIDCFGLFASIKRHNKHCYTDCLGHYVPIRFMLITLKTRHIARIENSWRWSRIKAYFNRVLLAKCFAAFFRISRSSVTRRNSALSWAISAWSSTLLDCWDYVLHSALDRNRDCVLLFPAAQPHRQRNTPFCDLFYCFDFRLFCVLFAAVNKHLS